MNGFFQATFGPKITTIELVNEQPGDEPENCVKAWIDWIGSSMQMLEESDSENRTNGMMCLRKAVIEVTIEQIEVIRGSSCSH